jgi:deoxyribonuclease V
MKIHTLHRWPRTSRAAVALQQQLRDQLCLQPVPRDIRIVAGADVAFSRDGQQVIAGVVVVDLQSAETLETRSARGKLTFPYVPGLLSFRELPAVLAALKLVRSDVQAVLCDGQGYAHPRRLGLAAHLGLWLDVPTVGCAKSRLCGEASEPGLHKGNQTKLMMDGEQIGVVLRTRDGVKPLYISPGHRCDHAGAVRLTLAATTRYRMPEPTRRADQLVGALRQSPSGRMPS